MRIQIPDNVNKLIQVLTENGYEAYAVGGCVRDTILGKQPEDWDITTSAKPQEVKRLFKRTVDTGIQHGTVTVLMDKEHYEVTTYRLDGEYEDNRHPKEVLFTSSLREDLRRRDFTINAMAYNDREGLIDLFDGMKDLENGLIRCVGSAVERFDEDALRILRAVRFSAQLGFRIEEATMQAVRDKAELLRNISAERIRTELNKLLISDHPDRLRILHEAGITAVILPEFDTMMVTDQKNIHHSYTVGEHTIRAVTTVAGSLNENRFPLRERSILRWTMLLHDVEKPASKNLGKDGQEHFYGHQERGAKTADRILNELKFDNDTRNAVVHLIRWHDYRFVLTPAGMRKAAAKIGKEYMELLFEVNRADTSGKNPDHTAEKYRRLETARKLYQRILEEEECVSLKELKLNGNDLIREGFRAGRELGQILNHLLDKVIEEPKLNDRDTLLQLAKEWKNRS